MLYKPLKKQDDKSDKRCLLELEIIGLSSALHYRVISHIPVAVSSCTLLSGRSPVSNIIHCSYMGGLPNVYT